MLRSIFDCFSPDLNMCCDVCRNVFSKHKILLTERRMNSITSVYLICNGRGFCFVTTHEQIAHAHTHKHTRRRGTSTVNCAALRMQHVPQDATLAAAGSQALKSSVTARFHASYAVAPKRGRITLRRTSRGPMNDFNHFHTINVSLVTIREWKTHSWNHRSPNFASKTRTHAHTHNPSDFQLHETSCKKDTAGSCHSNTI